MMSPREREFFEKHGMQVGDMEAVQFDVGSVMPVHGVMPLWMAEALDAAGHTEPFDPSLLDAMCDAYNRERNS